MHLLDANVLLALAWPSHVFHARATAWFDERVPRPWATCLITEAAFIRLSSNPKVSSQARRPGESAALLESWKTRGKHTFLSDSKLRGAAWREVFDRCLGHQQVSDAILVALAAAHGATLATFDARLGALAEGTAPVELLA